MIEQIPDEKPNCTIEVSPQSGLTIHGFDGVKHHSSGFLLERRPDDPHAHVETVGIVTSTWNCK
jgi:hypothetical protein